MSSGKERGSKGDLLLRLVDSCLQEGLRAHALFDQVLDIFWGWQIVFCDTIWAIAVRHGSSRCLARAFPFAREVSPCKECLLNC